MRLTRLLLAATALGLSASGPAQAHDTSCYPADIAALDGWNGVWLPEGMVSGLNGRAIPGESDFGTYFAFGGFRAPWNEEGRRRYAEAQAGGEREQLGWGFPVMMASPTPFEVIVGLAKTAIVGEYRDFRVIYTDGRDWDPDAWPTIYGESLGCWKGDTLEIETRGVHYTPTYNKDAPPLSDEAVFHERLRLTAPGVLELDATVTDPTTLDKVWVTHTRYFRHKVLERLVIEGGLEDNNRVVQVNGEYAIVGAEGGLAEDQQARPTGR